MENMASGFPTTNEELSLWIDFLAGFFGAISASNSFTKDLKNHKASESTALNTPRTPSVHVPNSTTPGTGDAISAATATFEPSPMAIDESSKNKAQEPTHDHHDHPHHTQDRYEQPHAPMAEGDGTWLDRQSPPPQRARAETRSPRKVSQYRELLQQQEQAKLEAIASSNNTTPVTRSKSRDSHTTDSMSLEHTDPPTDTVHTEYEAPTVRQNPLVTLSLSLSLSLSLL